MYVLISFMYVLISFMLLDYSSKYQLIEAFGGFYHLYYSLSVSYYLFLVNKV